MDKDEMDKLFKRIELLKSFDRCGFEFADGHNCTFDNIAICYDDRLKLYELVKKQKEVIDKAIEYVEWNKDKAKFDNNTKEYDNYTFLDEENIDELLDILKEVSE